MLTDDCPLPTSNLCSESAPAGNSSGSDTIEPHCTCYDKTERRLNSGYGKPGKGPATSGLIPEHMKPDVVCACTVDSNGLGVFVSTHSNLDYPYTHSN